MAKVNFRSMPRPQPEVETRTFHDPECAEPITVTFASRADFSEILVMQELTERLTLRYTQPGSIPPATSDGSIVRVTPRLCQVIATIQTLERPEDGQEPYTFEDWICASACARQAFTEIVAFAEEILVRAQAQAPRCERPVVPND